MDYVGKTIIDNIDDMTNIIKTQLNDIAEGFVSVGFYLRKTDETMLYKQKGYNTIYEYAKDTFGIGRSTASRFMEINQKYSKDGYSPEIDLKWSGYGSSKLTEMLGLPEDVQEAIPADATVRDIREAKGIIRGTEDKYSDQMQLCDIAQPTPEETNWLSEFVRHYFGGEGRSKFQEMTDWLRKDKPEDVTLSILRIVNPTKFKMIRLNRANVMLTVDKIKIMPYRNQGEQEEHTYIDFARAFETLFYPAGIATPIDEAYRSVYGEPYYQEKPDQKPVTTKQPDSLTKKEESLTKNEESLTKNEENPEKHEKTETKEQKEKTATPDAAPVFTEEQGEKTDFCQKTSGETQIPGQTELTKDFPEHCPPDMNPPEEIEQPPKAYKTRHYYMANLPEELAAVYMAKTMERTIRKMTGMSYAVLTKEDFWKEFLGAEVDWEGNEIECVN